MREILMEQSEFLMDLQELFTKQLEEVKRTCCVVMAIGFTVDALTEWMSWMEEESRDEGAKCIGKWKLEMFFGFSFV